MTTRDDMNNNKEDGLVVTARLNGNGSVQHNGLDQPVGLIFTTAWLEEMTVWLKGMMAWLKGLAQRRPVRLTDKR